MSTLTLTAEEVRARRAYFLKESDKVTKVRKGHKRVGGSRICSICQTQLSRVILRTGDTYATRDHYHCKVSDMLTIYMCKDSQVCQKVHKARREQSVSKRNQGQG